MDLLQKKLHRFGWLWLAVSLPVVAQNAAKTTSAEYSLVLVGGGLRSCSSMNGHQCQPAHRFDAATTKTAARYGVSDAAIARIAAANWWSPNRRQQQVQTVQLLRSLTDKTSQSAMALRQHWQRQRVGALSGAALYQTLTDTELDMIFDELELPVMDAGQQRLPERVNLAASLDKHSRQVYEKIAELAAKVKKNQGKSKILLVTASSRDPFAAVDYYLDLFRQIGGAAAPEVQWLPLSAAYQAAQRLQVAGQPGCSQLAVLLQEHHGSVNRAAVYPDLFGQMVDFCQRGTDDAVRMITQADAIFFNGGDQSLTWQALRQPDGSDTSELKAIRSAMRQGRLIVAGTSAGTAVQAGGHWQGHQVPMISNGTSGHALQHAAIAAPQTARACQQRGHCSPELAEDQLTYQPLGGLGLFPFGVLDTHFSERSREIRLVRLLSDTGTRFGFGVDEATALLVGFKPAEPAVAKLSVIGAAGVFIADLQQAQVQQTGSAAAGAGLVTPWQISKVRTHYLHAGQTASLTVNGLQLQQPQLPARQPDARLQAGDLLKPGHYRQITQQLCQQSFSTANGTAGRASLVISKTAQSRVFAADAQAAGTCTYQDFLLQISG